MTHIDYREKALNKCMDMNWNERSSKVHLIIHNGYC